MPDVLAEAAPVTSAPQVRIHRDAWRSVLHHSSDVARARGVEAIGWLLGFFADGEPHVLDAAPATRYKHQSRYGAAADPREEAELSLRYPRNVGIVGLYHSHPFRDETSHAIFHSRTDDATLKSRASRRENYVSLVTDGRSAECFVLRSGEPVAVVPEVSASLSLAPLHRSTASVAPVLGLTVARGDLPSVVGDLERRVSSELDRAFRGASVSRGSVRLPDLDGESPRNRVLVEPSDGRLRVDLSLRLEPVVYVAERTEPEVLAAMRNEIQDDIVFLLWQGFDAFGVSLEGVERFEANLGTLRVQETVPLPKKLYRAPKRSTVLRRRA